MGFTHGCVVAPFQGFRGDGSRFHGLHPWLCCCALSGLGLAGCFSPWASPMALLLRPFRARVGGLFLSMGFAHGYVVAPFSTWASPMAMLLRPFRAFAAMVRGSMGFTHGYVVAPFQGFRGDGSRFDGLCPWLCCCALSGLSRRWFAAPWALPMAGLLRPFRAFAAMVRGSMGFAHGCVVAPFQGFRGDGSRFDGLCPWLGYWAPSGPGTRMDGILAAICPIAWGSGARANSDGDW